MTSDRHAPDSSPAFGPYEIVRKIGDGGMGAVYEARHRGLDKRVAIKTLSREMAANPEISARFVREGRAAARVRHPHVVDVYDVGTSEVGTFLVMELLEGSDLGRVLESRGRLSVHEGLSLLLPVLSAVAAAHREGVIHRDLKPANIFLSRDSFGRTHPKVVDFGISKIVEEQGELVLTQSAAVLGTPYYMAPEQVQAVKNTGEKSDQYSLAVILFECLTGQRPFVAENLYELLLAVTSRDAPDASSLVKSVPRGLSDTIRLAMSRTPSDRFPSVRAFGEAILPFADELTQALWGAEFGAGRTPPHERPSQRAVASITPSPEASTVAATSGVNAGNPPTGLEFSSAKAPPRKPPLRVAFAGATAAVVAAVGVLGFFFYQGASPVSSAALSDSASAVPEAVSVATAAASGVEQVVTDAGEPPAPTASASATSSASRSAPSPGVRGTPKVSKITPPPTTAEPDVGAIRGANSAWIVR